jgi:hypothetical protein
MSTSLPLNENADARDATRRPRSSQHSSAVRTSVGKISFSSSRLMLMNGSTAIEGVSLSGVA